MTRNGTQNCQVEDTLDNTLTVGELRDLLSGYDEDAKVLFGCDYGDITHTTQALGLSSEAAEATAADLEESGYSQSRVAFNDPNEREPSETYCEACDEFYDGIERCPKCGAVCVTEDGQPATQADEADEPQVIVLRHNGRTY